MSTLLNHLGRLSVAAMLATLIGCGGASQEQEVTLESTDARLSYGVGLRMGQRMAADGMTVDVAAYAAGLVICHTETVLAHRCTRPAHSFNHRRLYELQLPMYQSAVATATPVGAAL